MFTFLLEFSIFLSIPKRFGNCYETWHSPNITPLTTAPYYGESPSEVRYLSALTTADHPDKKATDEMKEVSTRNRKADGIYSASSALSFAPSVYAETELPFSRTSAGSPPSWFDLQEYECAYPG